MQSATFEFGIPSAEVPERGDPEELIRRITAEINAFQSSFEETTVSVAPFQKKPVPAGAAGISELVTWGIDFYFNNQEQIKTALTLLPYLLRGISVAASYCMPAKKTKKEEEKHFVTVKIANQEISLPTDSESIDEFILKVNREVTLIEEKK
jgi:hypothetical protein